MKISNNKIISRINSQSEKISRVSKKVDELFETVTILTKANQYRKLKITNLEIKILAMKQNINKENNALPQQNVIEDLMDRQSRRQSEDDIKMIHRKLKTLFPV